jgi:hypothetical protein
MASKKQTPTEGFAELIRQRRFKDVRPDICDGVYITNGTNALYRVIDRTYDRAKLMVEDCYDNTPIEVSIRELLDWTVLRQTDDTL